MSILRAQRHFLPLWCLVLLMAWIIPRLTRKTEKPGEWYPFSSFPMYSKFEPATYYVFVTDLADKPIALSDVFGASTSNVKKAYDRKLINLKKASGDKARRTELSLEVRRSAAIDVLQWLATSAAKQAQVQALGGLRLHQVDIAFLDGQVTKTTLPVGEITFPKAAPHT
jgi:hypothetical protein